MKRANKKSIPEVIVDIHKLSHDGRGITQVEGKTLFIHGALPGEKVHCKVTYQHRRYNEGKIIRILVPSPERIEPSCPHFGICGGCSLQHLPYENQIKLKQKTLLEQLLHFGNVQPANLLDPISGQSWGYRNKARLGVRFVIKKNKLLVGFREKLSNYLADIDTCHVLHPSIGQRINELSQLIAKLTQYQHIPQVEVAIGDHQPALVFRHLMPLPQEDIIQLIQFGQQNQIHIYLQPNPPDTLKKIWPENPEKMIYSLPEFQLNMQFSPLDFTQINGEINAAMIKLAISLLAPKPDEQVLDLFCGLGNFTLPLSRFAKQVIGIEGNAEMVKQARENAYLNHVSNADFFYSNLMKPNPGETWIQQPYHKILLDPPRSGAKEILPFFPLFKPKRIVYISCNPATLARDAGELVHQQGYQLTTAGVINMFPHTSHIEAIAVFEAPDK